ncbi:MAG: vitamin K epoxide reductase family protein [Myxococcota bacterium]
MRPHPLTIVVAVGAILGFSFAAVSTYDFVAHLDRQVHGIHCSFLPGMGTVDASGSSGCHVTLMSPYSSVFRQGIWGGIPVSLPAMAVFGFILFWAAALVLLRRQNDTRATGFLALASLLPAVTSVVMAAISLGTLGTACKLCVGIYVSSALVLGGAVGLWLRARKASALAMPSGPGDPHAQTVEVAQPRMGLAALVGAFFLGVVMVAVSTVAYAAAAPDYSEYVGACGQLDQPNAPRGVLLPMGAQGAGLDAVEVLDPLCPACRGFERRLEASGLSEELARQALLFPLDSECNWMVDEPIHAGACTISEALLCAEAEQDAVLEWAFENQEDIRTASEADPEAAEGLVLQKFPQLEGCLGRPAVRAKLNRGLRWAVDNQFPVLTPQLYVEGVRMCDEDSDLGMDYALARMIERVREGTLPTEAP